MIEHKGTSSVNPRSLLIRMGLVLTLVVLAWQVYSLTRNTGLPINDTIEYWAAGRLNWSGQNPYDPTLLFPLQQTVGWQESRALMMYNPPWTFTLTMPLGWLPYGVAQTIWLFLNFGLILLASDWAWLFYGGTKKRRWVAWILGLFFFPSLIILRFGQISPFMLLGLIGFLHFQRKERWLWAGAALILVAIKPQLFHLFWLGLLCWTIDHKKWGVLWGSIGAGVAAMILPLTSNPQIVRQFLAASTQQSLADWATPTLGALLRLAFGSQHFWLQFLPPALSVVWFVFYWKKHRYDWQWGEQMPILLLVSLITSAYGWTYDQVVWIPIVMQIFVWTQRVYPRMVRNPLVWGYFGINFLIVLARTEFVGITNEFWYVWTGPLFLLVYLYVRNTFALKQFEE